MLTFRGNVLRADARGSRTTHLVLEQIRLI